MPGTNWSEGAKKINVRFSLTETRVWHVYEGDRLVFTGTKQEVEDWLDYMDRSKPLRKPA